MSDEQLVEASGQKPRQVLIWVEPSYFRLDLEVTRGITEALIRQGIKVTIASSALDKNGRADSYDIAIPATDILLLPPLRGRSGIGKRDSRFDSKLHGERQGALCRSMTGKDGLILIGGYPFTKFGYNPEMHSLLRAAGRAGAKIFTLVNQIAPQATLEASPIDAFCERMSDRPGRVLQLIEHYNIQIAVNDVSLLYPELQSFYTAFSEEFRRKFEDKVKDYNKSFQTLLFQADEFAGQVAQEISLPKTYVNEPYRRISFGGPYPELGILILDWDGTCVDTGNMETGIIARSYNYAIREMERCHPGITEKSKGWTFSRKVSCRSPYSAIDFFYANYNDDLELAKEAAALQEKYYKELLRARAKMGKLLFPGVRETLRFCKEKGIPVAVISSAPQNLVEYGIDLLLKDEFKSLAIIGSTPAMEIDWPATTECDMLVYRPLNPTPGIVRGSGITYEKHPRMLKAALAILGREYMIPPDIIENIYHAGDSLGDLKFSVKNRMHHVRIGSVTPGNMLTDMQTVYACPDLSRLMKLLESGQIKVRQVERRPVPSEMQNAVEQAQTQLSIQPSTFIGFQHPSTVNNPPNKRTGRSR